MTQKETLYSVIGVIAVVAVIGGIYWYMQMPQAPAATNTTTSSMADNSTATPGTEDTSAGVNGVISKLSYSAALNLYKDHRIQFSLDQNKYCIINPNTAVYKKGTLVMFDNRSSKALTVALDGQAYTIKAYGFRIITLTTTATLPHNVSVDCNKGENNGTITLEK